GPTDTSFGDFLVNFAPRLALYEAAGLDCPILLRWEPLPPVLSILEAMGVGPERIIFHAPEQISLFPKLYAPCWPCRDKLAPVAGVFDVFRRAAAPPGPERPMLYLDRRNNKKRALANEPEVAELFAARGFKIVEPGSLSFEEARQLFAAPACVAGVYGSAFLNLMFSGAHPPSLVLMPGHRPQNLAEFAQWQVDCGNRFAYVLGDIPPEPHVSYTPWTIPLDKVERALDGMMQLVSSGEPSPAG
ncbi:MAG TPA: glycosyltransferase family 61 protein, partial [Caulobacteraceae bacterium]|nr:glycosyltransferase family 61 protein [Caulobacteraceae bacterium]